jgi:hypothetical protein
VNFILVPDEGFLWTEAAIGTWTWNLENYIYPDRHFIYIPRTDIIYPFLSSPTPNSSTLLSTMADPRPLPTPMSILIGTAIIAGVSGYMLGMASSLGLIPNPFVARPPVRRGIHNYDDEEESAEEEVDEDAEGILDHAPNWANGYEADKRDGLRARTGASKEGGRKSTTASSSAREVPGWEKSKEECKLVLVVRTDLGMTKGRIYTILFLSTPTPLHFRLLYPFKQRPN